jgi:thiol-disulfide isomerase/thioredoxin
MKTLLALFFTIGSAYAAQVPDYTVKIGLDPASKVPRWLVEGIPPVNFHFNLKAGAKVSVKGKRATFTPVIETESRLGFSSSSMELKEGDSLETAFYLCDQAKTLCVRKTLSLPMRVNSSLTHFESQNPTVKEKPRPKPAQKQKDSHGFFLNDIEGAQSEARRSQKPLLIDFFGIWCPPCNLYSETVFPDPRFQKIAKKFVLLKLDADQEVSFPLKS